MNDIPPPKLKSSRGKKRESKPIASLAKARQSARLSMKKQQTKLNKLKSKLQSATRVAQTKKENLKHIEKVLDGKEIQVIDERILESIPDNVRDLIDTQNIVFKPNKGPQTQFLASAEKEVFYATLKSEDGRFDKQVTIEVPRSIAPEFKSGLESVTSRVKFKKIGILALKS